MYIVRSRGHWDNPKIEFVTNDESIAKAVVEKHKQQAYTEWLKSPQNMIDLMKEHIEFYEFKVASGKTIEPYDIESYESDKETLEHYTKLLKTSYAEWSEKKYYDWQYEQAPLVDEMDAALAEYGDR